jgi:hypothetical protein
VELFLPLPCKKLGEERQLREEISPLSVRKNLALVSQAKHALRKFCA